MDLERLLDAWRAPLTGLLAAWGAPWPEARDLAADVFAEAWLSRARFEGDPDDERRVGAWLRGIARNLFLAARREREPERRRAHPSADDAAALAADPRSDDDPDERALAVRAALDALEPELREALYIRHVDEVPLSAVAALLGISERAAEGRLYRARQRLKQLVERSTRAQELRP